MKKLLLILLCLPMIGFGQDFKMQEKMVTGVFELDSISKSELFTAINKWISINYNSANNVIQMSDKESGVIIIKGINEVSCKNIRKPMLPNFDIPECITIKFNHLIEISIKNNRFRIIYSIINVVGTVYNNDFFNCISFNGSNDKEISVFKESEDIILKSLFVGKKKREKCSLGIEPMFKELKNTLIKDIKQTMKSIEQSVKSNEDDDW
jgi:hypothetical protein